MSTSLTATQLELLKLIEPLVAPSKLKDRQEEVEELQRLGYVTAVRGTFNDGLPDVMYAGLSFEGFKAIGSKPKLYAHPERDATIEGIKKEVAAVPYADSEYSFGDLIEEANSFHTWFWTRGSKPEKDGEQTFDDYVAQRISEIKEAVANPESYKPSSIQALESVRVKFLADPLGYILDREITNALTMQQCALNTQASVIEQLIRMLAEARLGCQYTVDIKSEAKKEEEVEPAA